MLVKRLTSAARMIGFPRKTTYKLAFPTSCSFFALSCRGFYFYETCKLEKTHTVDYATAVAAAAAAAADDLRLALPAFPDKSQSPPNISFP